MWQERLIKYANTSKDKTVREMIEAMEVPWLKMGKTQRKDRTEKVTWTNPRPTKIIEQEREV